MTRRMTDQRNASRSSDGSTACSGPWLVKRAMGVWPVSACTRVLHYLLGPGQETIVQLGEAGNAVRLGLREEAFANEAIEPLLLAAALG